MTVAQRIAAIRLMEKLEESKSSHVIKEKDGTIKYLDKTGKVVVEAKFKA